MSTWDILADTDVFKNQQLSQKEWQSFGSFCGVYLLASVKILHG